MIEVVGPFVLIVIYCGWGCGESSHYEQYPTKGACETAGAAIPDGTFRFSFGDPMTGEPMVTTFHQRYFRCERGETQHDGQTWTADGRDPWK